MDCKIKLNIIRVVLGIILVGMFILGVWLSRQSGSESNELTDRIMVMLEIVTEEDVENSSGDYVRIRLIFREMGHFVMYALGAVVVYMFIYSITGNVIITTFLAMITVAGYAVFDEYSQSMVVGRTSERLDVVIDLSGAAFSIMVCLISIIVGKVVWREKEIKKSEGELKND